MIKVHPVCFACGYTVFIYLFYYTTFRAFDSERERVRVCVCVCVCEREIVCLCVCDI